MRTFLMCLIEVKWASDIEIYRGGIYWVATQSATLRHMSRLLRLLPSGPGRVHRVSLRRDRKGHHRLP